MYDWYNSNNPEFNMYNDINNEFTDHYGIPVKYLQRTRIKDDVLFGEDVLSEFNNAIFMKLYLKDYSGFTGQGDFFSKFGLQVDDQMTLTGPKDYLENLLGTEPIEGDLVWMQFNNTLFEIKHVEDEIDSFFWFGQKMIYSITMRKFEYSHEDFNTQDDTIDAIDGITEIPGLDETLDEQDEIDLESDSVIDNTETFGI